MSEIQEDKLNIIYEDTLLEITPELMKKTILKQDKEIEKLKDKIISLETERDVLKSTLSETKADIKYLLQSGEGNGYIRNKYLRK